jgi:hypothetical protein
MTEKRKPGRPRMYPPKPKEMTLDDVIGLGLDEPYDRLAQIRQRHSQRDADEDWLIEEVERLRGLLSRHHDCTTMSKLKNGLPCPVCGDQAT